MYHFQKLSLLSPDFAGHAETMRNSVTCLLGYRSSCGQDNLNLGPYSALYLVKYAAFGSLMCFRESAGPHQPPASQNTCAWCSTVSQSVHAIADGFIESRRNRQIGVVSAHAAAKARTEGHDSLLQQILLGLQETGSGRKGGYRAQAGTTGVRRGRGGAASASCGDLACRNYVCRKLLLLCHFHLV